MKNMLKAVLISCFFINGPGHLDLGYVASIIGVAYVDGL